MEGSIGLLDTTRNGRSVSVVADVTGKSLEGG